jgi:Protein of unknown function (DUF3467)
MNESPPSPPGGENRPPENQPGSPPPPGNDSGAYSQQFSHNPPVAARVPEKMARAAYATGLIVLDNPAAFILDFLQGMSRPYQVAARVVIHPTFMAQLAGALQDNVNKHVATFGPPPVMPAPPQNRPSIQEIYENFKLSDDQLSGAYANAVMINHSRAEYHIDFITDFYPTAAVSTRIFLSAFQAPRILDTLNMALQQYQKRQKGGPPPAPAAPPPQTESPER